MAKVEVGDPFIKRTLGPVLVLLVVLVLIPGTLALLIGVLLSQGAEEPGWALKTYQLWRSADSLPWDLAVLAGHVLPALLAALVFRVPSQQQLTTVGRITFVLLILGVPIALSAMILTGAISPNNIDGGQPTIDLLRSGADGTLKLSAMNLGLILGVRTPIKLNGG